MAQDDERIKRVYALAESLGRLSGEAHNLMNQLARKMAAARAGTRPTDSVKPRRTRREKDPCTSEG
jgi:hypothetical protein